MSRSAILKSSLAKKYWMSATGLFLCVFLLGHLAGNLQLFIEGAAGEYQFNQYAKFMTTNPAVKLLSYLTYASILFHAIDGLMLTIQNKKARPVNYAVFKASTNSTWASRNMGVLGTVLLAFIVTHMTNFWAVMHWGEMPMQTVDPDGKILEEPLKNLHMVVMNFFNPAENSLALVATVLYVLSMVAIAFHLSHGFHSAFQSLGLRIGKYGRLIVFAGKVFAIVVPTLFAIIPIYLYFKQA
jgi:succinate dehydrogenase / fumarate reductase, cytochrome b subunit